MNDADEKISFLLYKEWGDSVRMLNDDERSKLLIAIYDYQEFGRETEFNGQLKMLYTMIIKQFIRDNKKWLEIKNKRSEAGKKGAEGRWNRNKDEYIDEIKQILGNNYNIS